MPIDLYRQVPVTVRVPALSSLMMGLCLRQGLVPTAWGAAVRVGRGSANGRLDYSREAQRVFVCTSLYLFLLAQCFV